MQASVRSQQQLQRGAVVRRQSQGHSSPSPHGCQESPPPNPLVPCGSGGVAGGQMSAACPPPSSQESLGGWLSEAPQVGQAAAEAAKEAEEVAARSARGRPDRSAHVAPERCLPSTWVKDFDLNPEEQFIGGGAFAKIVRVVARTTGEAFAMKVMSRSNFAVRGIEAQVDAEIEAMRRCVEAGTCDHVVRLHDSAEEGDHVYMRLELCCCDLLRLACSQPAGHLDEVDARVWARQLLQGLGDLHRLGILHRDIKPENLLCTGDGTLKISDFGWCAETRSGPCELAGTLQYMAPEILGSQGAHTEAVDMWSAGVTLLQLLSGRQLLTTYLGPGATGKTITGPHQATRVKTLRLLIEIRERCPLGSSMRPPHVSPACWDLLAKMLVPEVAMRISVSTALAHPWTRDVVEPGIRDAPCSGSESGSTKDLATAGMTSSGGGLDVPTPPLQATELETDGPSSLHAQQQQLLPQQQPLQQQQQQQPPHRVAYQRPAAVSPARVHKSPPRFHNSPPRLQMSPPRFQVPLRLAEVNQVALHRTEAPNTARPAVGERLLPASTVTPSSSTSARSVRRFTSDQFSVMPYAFKAMPGEQPAAVATGIPDSNKASQDDAQPSIGMQRRTRRASFGTVAEMSHTMDAPVSPGAQSVCVNPRRRRVTSPPRTLQSPTGSVVSATGSLISVANGANTPGWGAPQSRMQLQEYFPKSPVASVANCEVESSEASASMTATAEQASAVHVSNQRVWRPLATSTACQRSRLVLSPQPRKLFNAAVPSACATAPAPSAVSPLADRGRQSFRTACYPPYNSCAGPSVHSPVRARASPERCRGLVYTM